MVSESFALPPSHLPKALRYMRGLRRAIVSYWYATIEHPESAAIEAINATFLINVLDEAIFQDAHGDAYKTHRRADRLGRVVMGLELIRNCETHASRLFDGLMVEDRRYGVPLGNGRSVMRHVLEWSAYDAIPKSYRELPRGAFPNLQRARGEALDGYRKAVQCRHVIETLFDAMAFFQALDSRLEGAPFPAMRWAFGVCELPKGTDFGTDEDPDFYLARVIGIDPFEPFLPDLACRSSERRSATWPAADVEIKRLAEAARKKIPEATAREVLYALRDELGRLIGYSGYAAEKRHRSPWVERHTQVWRDVRMGYRYFLVHEGTEIDLVSPSHEKLQALGTDGIDLLADLPDPDQPSVDLSWLRMVEDYDDLYLRMRHDH